MTSPRQWVPRQWALLVAVGHAFFAATASSIHNLLWGEVSFAWEAGHALRLVDRPVVWAADWLLQRLTLPGKWLNLSATGTLAIHEALVYVVLGGAFWATLTYLLSHFLSYRKARASD